MRDKAPRHGGALRHSLSISRRILNPHAARYKTECIRNILARSTPLESDWGGCPNEAVTPPGWLKRLPERGCHTSRLIGASPFHCRRSELLEILSLCRMQVGMPVITMPASIATLSSPNDCLPSPNQGATPRSEDACHGLHPSLVCYPLSC